MTDPPHRALVEEAFADRSKLADPAYARAVEDTVRALDRGEVRVASPPETEGGEWTVNTWLKQAILLFFAMRKMERIELGPFEYYDKIPLKKNLEAACVRVVPPGHPPAVLTPGAHLVGR